MMNKINLKATALLICLSAVTIIGPSAFAASFATDLGFNRLDSQSTPDAVLKTADSVFEARVIFEDSPKDVTSLDLTDPKLKDIDQKIDSIEKLDSREKVVVKNQIQRCRRENIEKQCPVFFTIEKATAFLVGGDGSYLATNAHVMNGFLKLVSSLTNNKPILDLLKEPQRILIYLFDRNGTLVFDPYLNQAVITKFGKPSALALAQSNWYAEDSDYVVLKLDRVLGKPIKIAPSYQPGQQVYHTGFAACTGCASAPNTTDPELNRDRSPKPNSNGIGYYWTGGTIQDASVARAFINADWYLNLARLDDMIFFSADSQVGMSGGPILNESGEAVGVFAGSKPKINPDGSMSVLSRGVRPVEFSNH